MPVNHFIHYTRGQSRDGQPPAIVLLEHTHDSSANEPSRILPQYPSEQISAFGDLAWIEH